MNALWHSPALSLAMVALLGTGGCSDDESTASHDAAVSHADGGIHDGDAELGRTNGAGAHAGADARADAGATRSRDAAVWHTDPADPEDAGRAKDADSGSENGADSGPALSCTERAQQSSYAVGEAVAAATRLCGTNADCEHMSTDTACSAGCGALLSKTDAVAVQAVVAEQNVGVCRTYAADGCGRILPPCAAPPPFDCIAGHCAAVP
jgi:hypothetical protein